ncbi:MAG: hypothetical protein RLZZ84_528 [Pseudomonadota bacterium]|jgi:hypothetical protein
MATINPAPDAARNPVAGNPAVNPARRARRRVVAVLAVALSAALAWFWQPLNGYARIGSAYGARVACSCHYLGGRSLSDCRKDFEPGMQLITLSDDKETKSVTARFPLLASQTATYREGEGCQLEPWHE